MENLRLDGHVLALWQFCLAAVGNYLGREYHTFAPFRQIVFSKYLTCTGCCTTWRARNNLGNGGDCDYLEDNSRVF